MNKDISLKSKSLKLACLGKLITQNVLLVSLMIVSNAAHSASAVKGYIDRIAKVGDNYYASGWACQTGSNASIKVHLYAGGAAGAGGSYFTNGTASNNSETGVANACGSTGTNHRFKVLIPVSARSAHAGKKLYVHGISTIGSGNLAISRSGSYSIPAPPPPPAPTLSFGWYPSTIISGETTHREWSTTNADSCIGDNGSSVGTSGVSQENVQTQGKTVTMTCSGPGGSVSKSITLTVLPAIPSTPSRPSGSSSVITNQSFTISWSNVSGATSYQLYKNGSNVYSGSSTSKSQSIPASGSYSYTVKACNSTGCSAASSSRTVTVAPPPAPTLSFAWYPNIIVSGDTSHREWSTTNADTCIGDNGSSVGTSGVSQENVHTVDKTVTMTCNGAGGEVSKTITLTVNPALPDRV